MSARWKVLAGHRQSYADPVAFARGDCVRLTGREDCWDGHRWVWAIGPDGREGWIPPHTVEPFGDGFRACRDYSARELTVAPGDCVTAGALELGWRWCRNAAGEEGWVPDRVLAPPADGER